MSDQEHEHRRLLGKHRLSIIAIADQAFDTHPDIESAAVRAATNEINVKFTGILGAIALKVAISLAAEVIKRRILKRMEGG